MRLACVTLVILLVCQIIGIAVFCIGFFPKKVPLDGYNSFGDLPPDLQTGEKWAPPPAFAKAIVMLIDAFRGEFLFENRSSAMQYTQGLINKKESFSYLTRAQAPTVTLPRIKALTSGSIPSFLDFILNFESPAMKEDNWITQSLRANKQLVLYGDDTWLRLFPAHFTRYDGTTSFYVADTVEVDVNVSRHLDSELSDMDFDVLLLHYLGLDHVGHGAGPYSVLMQPKQAEMDAVIQKIHQSLVEKAEKERTTSSSIASLPTLFLICSDHGMNEFGNHGGSSEGETSAIAVFLSTSFSEGRGAKREIPMRAEVSQVDIAATMSVLLGLPIPKNNVGTVIHELLHSVLPAFDYLRALQCNAAQLFDVLRATHVLWNNDRPANAEIQHLTDSLKMAERYHLDWLKQGAKDSADFEITAEDVATAYRVFLSGMQTQFQKLIATYDVYAMSVGTFILFLCALCLLASLTKVTADPTGRTLSFVRVRTIIKGALVSVFLHATHRLLLCSNEEGSLSYLLSASSSSSSSSSSFSESMLCEKHGVLSLLSWFSSAAITITATMLLDLSYSPASLLRLYKNLSAEQQFLVLGTFLHLVSMGASSSVEEEHQTWYFLCFSVFTIILAKTFSRYLCVRSRRIETKEDPLPALFACFSLLFLLRISRGWNSTGNKWASVPDYADWLSLPDNSLYLRAVYVVSAISVAVAGITAVHVNESVRTTLGKRGCLLVGILHFGGLLSGLAVKDKITIFGITPVWWARVCYACVLLLFLLPLLLFFQSRLKLSQSFSSSSSSRSILWFETTLRLYIPAFSLLLLLLYRIHNCFLLVLMLLSALCIITLSDYYTHIIQGSSTVLWCAINYWLGMFFYFSLGNSNSLATIDVSGAYTGLDGYSPVIVGSLTTIILFSAPSFYLLLSILIFTRQCWKESSTQKNDGGESFSLRSDLFIMQLCYTLCSIRTVPLAFFSFIIVWMRHHLFIWSVFTPKYMYELYFFLVVQVGTVGCLLLLSVFWRACVVRANK